MISGWFAHHSAANFDKLRELGRRSSKPVCLIVGPWVHGPHMLQETTAGDADFGADAAMHAPTNDLWLRWLDATLADRAAPVLPPLSYFVMGTGDGHRTQEGKYFHGGEWREAERWPPHDMRSTSFFLRRGSRLSTTPAEPDEGSSGYTFDPSSPCPSIGGNNQQTDDLPEFILPGPRDQRCRADFAACRECATDLGERGDVLSFWSAPLTHDTEVTGDLACELWVSSDATDTDFVVRLIDQYPVSPLHPEGLALLISEGALRMRYREAQSTADLIEPGETYRISIELAPTSNVFKAGHLIRLDVTSSAFPAYDVNPNTGEPLGLHTAVRLARQTVFHSALERSALLLPLRRAS